MARGTFIRKLRHTLSIADLTPAATPPTVDVPSAAARSLIREICR